MSTVNDIVKGAMELIGALAAGETPSAEDGQTVLRSLNNMVAGWNTQGLAVLGKTIEPFTLTANDGQYTLGAGGDFNTTVPVKIDQAFLKDGNQEYPLEIVDNKKWGMIHDKTLSGDIPSIIYIDQNYPLRNVFIWPKPIAADTLILHVWRQFSAFASLSTSISLPQGYEEALEYNLAIRIAPKFGQAIPAEVASIAAQSLSNIKRMNIQPREVGVDPGMLGQAREFDINSGGYL